VTSLSEARGLFSPETAYLNTAGYGLPPRPAFEALTNVLDQQRPEDPEVQRFTHA
jgi:hypothetical protein